VGACCLAGGIWAMHFIAMLAFEAPLQIHYDLPLTLLSLLIALVAAWLAMNTLSHAHMPLWRYGVASIWIGLCIASMHYVG
ncbi:MHYT domain-containing protein, partial [Pseudomonas sp. SIMBA_077]